MNRQKLTEFAGNLVIGALAGTCISLVGYSWKADMDSISLRYDLCYRADINRDGKVSSEEWDTVYRAIGKENLGFGIEGLAEEEIHNYLAK